MVSSWILEAHLFWKSRFWEWRTSGKFVEYYTLVLNKWHNTVFLCKNKWNLQQPFQWSIVAPTSSLK